MDGGEDSSRQQRLRCVYVCSNAGGGTKKRRGTAAKRDLRIQNIEGGVE